MKSIVAIILARAGSKSIPNKNIVNFCGKPLLVWSIEQAKKVKEISSVWVSSDSNEILNIAKEHVTNTILRPKELSNDLSSSESGWIHAINEIKKNGHKVDLVIALQATSPIRESSDIERGLKDFEAQQCDSMFSACSLTDLMIWERLQNEEFRSVNFDYKNRTRRQERSNQYLENGSFYIFKPEILLNNNNRLVGKIGITLMELWKGFEIDDHESLEMCETLMRHYLLNKEKNHE
ncbi:MAG: cytidylyltransferase domain-containing protein [Nitrosotalea sp.]